MQLRRSEAARERLEELSSHKDRFVATMSHELRTPLTSVLGFVELLQEGGFDEDDRKDILDLVSDEATEPMVATAYCSETT